MAVGGTLYFIVLIFLNYGLPLFLFRRSSNKEVVLIIAGVVWFIESSLFDNALERGYENDALLGTFYIFSVIPIPYLLLLVGVIFLIIRITKTKTKNKALGDDKIS